MGGYGMETWIWTLLGLIFLYMAYTYWGYSNSPLRSFSSRRRVLEDGPSMDDADGLAREVEEELKEFEGYLSAMNTKIRSRFRVGAIGFLIASFTALFGIFLA